MNEVLKQIGEIGIVPSPGRCVKAGSRAQR